MTVINYADMQLTASWVLVLLVRLELFQYTQFCKATHKIFYRHFIGVLL